MSSPDVAVMYWPVLEMATEFHIREGEAVIVQLREVKESSVLLDTDGCDVGCEEGDKDGCDVGFGLGGDVGRKLGFGDGKGEGFGVGIREGKADGIGDGPAEG